MTKKFFLQKYLHQIERLSTFVSRNEIAHETMGTFHEILHEMTAKQLAEKEGVTVRAINTRWNAKFPGEVFDSNAVLSPDQIRELREVSRKKKSVVVTPAIPKEKPRTVSDAVRPLSAKPQKRELPTLAEVRTFLFYVVGILVVLGHGFMIWQETAELYGWIGSIGGLVVFLVVCLALMLAFDASKNRTSGYALWFMALVDFAAGFVHYEALKSPAVPERITIGICVFICASSFAALFLIQDSKQD